MPLRCLSTITSMVSGLSQDEVLQLLQVRDHGLHTISARFTRDGGHLSADLCQPAARGAVANGVAACL